MRNKKYTIRNPYTHQQITFPFGRNYYHSASSPSKAGIFDINFIFDTSSHNNIMAQEHLKVKSRPKKQSSTIQHPSISSVQHEQYQEIEMAPCPHYNKTEAIRSKIELLFKKERKQQPIHSRKTPRRRVASERDYRKPMALDKQSRQSAKQKVKAKILKGDSIIRFVQSPSLDLSQKIEGRHLTYNFSRSESRTSRSKFSHKTFEVRKPELQRSSRKASGSGQPRTKYYRPWSPVGGYNDFLGDQEQVYFLQTQH